MLVSTNKDSNSGYIGIMEKNMEATIMENQMEKKMENEMETVVIETQNTTFLVLQTPQRGPRFLVGSGIGSCARP